jgi:Holliday junction resolvase RusA-like endonuclease
MKALEIIAAGTPVAIFEFASLPSWNQSIAKARGNRFAAAKDTKAWRDEGYGAAMACRKFIPSPIDRCAIVVRVWRKSISTYDVHNICVKAVLDGFTDANVWQDDSYQHVPLVIFSHEGIDPVKPRVEIEIYKLELNKEQNDE